MYYYYIENHQDILFCQIKGLLLPRAVGVAKNAIIHPIKALSDDGSGTYSDVIEALRWAADDAANNGWPAVISLSLGGPQSISLDQAVNEVVNRGYPVIVAAGNEFGADTCGLSPAGASEATAVGATDRNDRKASFSNIGKCLDIWAPGNDIHVFSFHGFS